MTPDALLERARDVVLAHGLGVDPCRALGLIGVEGRLRIVPHAMGVALLELLGLVDVAELVRSPAPRALYVVALTAGRVAVAEFEIGLPRPRGLA